MSEKAIVLNHVGMKFNLSKEKVDNLKDYLIKSLKREVHYNEFWALKDINVEIEKGDQRWRGACHHGTERSGKEYTVKGNRGSI